MRKIDGEPVGNAAVAIRLTITKADIQKGAPLNPNACAVALGAVRQMPEVIEAKAHLGCIYLRFRGQRGWRRYRTSQALAREIVAFDRGGKFFPGEYDLLPVPTGALIKRLRGESKPRSRSGPKRRKPHITEGVRDTARADEPPAQSSKP
jgi:hypothetical protein